MYMVIGKPWGIDDFDNVKAMAESIVMYWDNIATKYKSSKGCLLPANIYNTLDKCSNSIPKASGMRYACIGKMAEMWIFFGIFCVGLLVVLCLSYHMSIEHIESRYAITVLPDTSRVIKFFRITNNRSAVSDTYDGYDVFFYTEIISRSDEILQNISTYLTERVQAQMYRSRHTIFGGVASVVLLIVFIFYVTSGVLSKLRKQDALRNIETDKFQTFKHVQKLFEYLQKASDNSCDGQDCVIYKNEIFSDRNIIDALRSVKKDMQDTAKLAPKDAVRFRSDV